MKFDIHHYDSVGSTMDVARDMASQTGKDYLVCQADEQIGGRGRRGNQWVSPKGNLYQSIILRPATPRHAWGQLSFVIALALGDTCLELGLPQDELALKWPNDVLVNGQKLAGILIEAEDNFVNIGTGVNIAFAPDERSKIHDFSQITLNECRDLFLFHIDKQYQQWEGQGFPAIRSAWMKHAYMLGKPIQARIQTAVYEGVFENLDDTGTLILTEKDGLMRKINAGEIIACS